jgi:single-stranded DNA-binding protein
MMNILLLSGFVGTTERRLTAGGTPYLVFSLATTRRVRASHGWESVTDWHAYLVRGSFGDSAARHITPNAAVDLQGTLEYPKGDARAGAIVVVTAWELRRRPQVPQPSDLLSFVDTGDTASPDPLVTYPSTQFLPKELDAHG